MELSKEVHGLLERIKKLSKQAQKNESYSTTPVNVSLNYSYKNLDSSISGNDEITYNSEDLIAVDNMDFSDNERWLYVSENSMVNPHTGDLKEWLRQDFVKDSVSQFVEFEEKLERKFIDTRTFTRPKKRISRPSLEHFSDSFTKLSDSKSSISEDLSDSYQECYSGPVNFKLSEPVYNTSFERILATANESIDSFTNMSPPSLMNSLCSSTFTTLMDSGYVNQEVPNVETENDDPNVTYIAENKSLNDTYDIKLQNKSDINNTYAKIHQNDLNSTFQKNITNKSDSPRYNLSNTSTFTKKPKSLSSKLSSKLSSNLSSSLSNSLKASCPDINKTFQKNHDLDLTFQKLSDSQPNLTEDLKRTIFNQSMELMNPTGEIFHSARSGSADSLDDRSSSISNSSSKDSTKILNMGELDALAKVQEHRLQQAMSTPIKFSGRQLLLEGEVLSPIQSRSVEDSEDNLSRSDSDLSDSCVTARSGLSKRSSPARSIGAEHHAFHPRSEVNVTRAAKPEVRAMQNLLPTMIVKPMEIKRTMVQPNRAQSAPMANAVRPKVRTSGLPRPTIAATGIPRPMSRIPGPKSLRQPSSRPLQRQPASSKSDWMDGCY